MIVDPVNFERVPVEEMDEWLAAERVRARLAALADPEQERERQRAKYIQPSWFPRGA